MKRTFDLYASDRYSLKTLNAEMHRIGLRSRGGHRVSKAGLSAMLNNPFYIGPNMPAADWRDVSGSA